MLQLWKVRDAVERFEGMLVLQVAGLVGLVSLKSGLVGLYCCILYTAYCILDTVVVVVVCCCLFRVSPCSVVLWLRLGIPPLTCLRR